MQALILAGGKGTRLRPYTTVLPKPMMPIGEMPILEIIIRQLKSAGVDSVIIAVGFMSHLFESFFQNGERYGLKIQYSFEEKPLGTAGPISIVIDQLEEDFLVLNGDVLTTLDYKALLDDHIEKKAAATISLHRRKVFIDYGVINYDGNNKLLGYIEKPTYEYDVSMGINVLNKLSVMDLVKPNKYLDIPDLMMQINSSGKLVNCYQEDCEWLDIGRVDDYQLAIDLFDSKRPLFLKNLE